MNEEAAHKVLLVRAIETSDTQHLILNEDDRLYASRSASELAQWEASETGGPVTPALFLQKRASQILERLATRLPAFGVYAHARLWPHWLDLSLPLLALCIGAGIDRIADPHRVDLLSAPFLLIILWNLAVYVALLVNLLVRPATQPLPWHWLGKTLAVPRKLPPAMATILGKFALDWAALSAPLQRARLARLFHFSAAAFATGAVLSLYARGLLSQYQAVWESTFLTAAQVHGLLSLLFAPAIALFPLSGFSLADIDALQAARGTGPNHGALWVHLYGATLLLMVILPRLLLGLVAGWRTRRLVDHFPLDLGHPYFVKLTANLGPVVQTVLRVLPYSFTVDETRENNLHALACAVLGEQTRLMLRPVTAYGAEGEEGEARTPAGKGSLAAGDPNTITVVLFNLSATPEQENHGVFLAAMAAANGRGVAVLVDESGMLERGADAERLAQRLQLWEQFCARHKAPLAVVNLHDPGLRRVEFERSLARLGSKESA